MKKMNIYFEMCGNDASYSSKKNEIGIVLKNFNCDLTNYHLSILEKAFSKVLSLLNFYLS